MKIERTKKKKKKEKSRDINPKMNIPEKRKGFWKCIFRRKGKDFEEGELRKLKRKAIELKLMQVSNYHNQLRVQIQVEDQNFLNQNLQILGGW